jgi:c-di-GMP-binding flagellar brake protein YcgR
MTDRRNRKHIRIPIFNQPELETAAHPKAPYVIDISMTGIGIILPSDLDYALDETLTLEISVPCLLNEKSEYQNLSINARCVRKAPYASNHLHYGLEFILNDSFSQDIIYQYIISRKNELFSQTSELLALKILKINNQTFT